jgi:O-antigen/teichoic acid export membrane protein
MARYYVTYNTVLTLSTIAQAGLGFTTTVFVARHKGRQPERAAAVIAFSLKATLLIGLAGALALLLTSALVAQAAYADVTLQPFLAIAAATFPFAALALVQAGALAGFEAFKKIAAGALLYAPMLLVLGLGGAWLYGPIGAAIGLALATIARVGLMKALLGSEHIRSLAVGARPSFTETWRELRGFAVPAGLIGLTLTPALWLSNAALVRHQGLAELGIFSAAFTIKLIVTFIPQQIGAVFLPRYMADVRQSGAAARLGVAVLIVFVISAAIAGLCTAFSAEIMGIFGPGFESGGVVLRWLMIAAVAESVASILSYQLAGQERMWKSFLYYSTPKDIFLVVTAYVLAPQFGAVGLAWAHGVAWCYGLLSLIGIQWALVTRAHGD